GSTATAQREEIRRKYRRSVQIKGNCGSKSRKCYLMGSSKDVPCILGCPNYDSVFAFGADYDSHFWVDGGDGAACVGVCVAGGFRPAAGAARADSWVQRAARRGISDHWYRWHC